MNDDERKMVAACLAQLDGRMKTVGDLLARLTTGVLDSGTYVFDASGMVSRDYQVPFQAVSITNRTGARIVVEAATPRSSPPLTGVSGPGISDLQPGESQLINVTGYALTVYGGNPGDRIQLQTFGRPQAPAYATHGALPWDAETLSVAGVATAPTAAGAPIATIAAPPAGLYDVRLKGHYAGTPTPATERNNIGLYRAGVLFYTLPLPGQAASNSYDVPTSPPLRVRLDGTQALTVQALTDATAGAVYDVGLTATKIRN